MARKQSNTDVPVLYFKKLNQNAVIPERKTKGSCGLDLHVLDNLIITPATQTKEAFVLHTGLAVEIPEGYYLAIYLRSSTGKTTKLRLANGTGIIDSDYRGEIMLLVENVGREYEYIDPGSRIAQMVLIKEPEYKIETAEELSDTKRGTGGFGSTGK